MKLVSIGRELSEKTMFYFVDGTPSTVFKKSTFQKISHSNALRSKLDLAVK